MVILWSVLATSVGVSLFMLKHEVQSLETDLDRINRSIEAGEENIHVLEAEWSYLNDPPRLRRLAETLLGMTPVLSNQITTIAALPEGTVVADNGAAPPQTASSFRSTPSFRPGMSNNAGTASRADNAATTAKADNNVGTASKADNAGLARTEHRSPAPVTVRPAHGAGTPAVAVTPARSHPVGGNLEHTSLHAAAPAGHPSLPEHRPSAVSSISNLIQAISAR
ncbi:MAG: hypothetical protein HQL37_05865 [Alphaproteobacteria bacterium]|nr:hypothetical protein [Alphaproteobacteria bacterium]